MKKLLICFIIFILSISVVLAVDVATDKSDYTGDEIVTITISDCVGTSIVKILNPSSTLSDIKSGQDNWVADYNTLSDSADGKYKVGATCTNGAAEAEFCVDEDGCLGEEEEEEPAPSPGGGGVSCNSDWSCSVWSYCGADLKQTRTCTDKNRCENPKIETRDCTKCLESWVCSLWSDCQIGDNERNCYDEHKCGTSSLKPHLRKSCSELDASGPSPARVSTQLPPPYVAPPTSKKSVLKRYWDDYGMYLILGLGILIVLVVIIVLLLHFLKSRRLAYNIDELKQWVRKERTMGTSMEDIKEILEDHTGWKKKEINMVTKDFVKPSEKVKKPV